jgi:signal transduction histidine kinase
VAATTLGRKPPAARTLLGELARWWPAAALLATTFGYLAVYLLIAPATGRSAGVLISLPVIASAWFYGWPGSALAMAVFLPINMALAHVMSPSLPLRDAISVADAPGIVVAWTVGIVVGRWRDVERMRSVASSARVTAEAESLAMNRFLATMNHELRTPLNSILGFSQLLAHQGAETLTEKQLRQLRHIQSSGLHMLGLISDILDLSKIAGGQMEVDVTRLELRPLLEESVAKMRPLADDKSLRLTLDAGPEAWVQSDRRRLFQVLLNLLSNAIKFTAPGGEISVTMNRVGEIAEVSVADTGIGIVPEDQERIFEEFVQVEPGSPDAGVRGTGLGLAMSRRLLILMGSSIRLISTPGKGSVFTIAVPVARSRSLVVVDPEGGLAERLGQSPYTVFQGSGVRDAAQLASEHRPAAVILGEAVGREDERWIRDSLRRSQATAAIPILARAADRSSLLREIADAIRID